MLSLPVIARRKKEHYLAIKSRLTMRQISKQGPIYLSEVRDFMAARDIRDSGAAFFRYNIIDMDGDLEMEFGYLTPRPYQGGGPVRSGVMPGGRFASVFWQGAYKKLYDVNAVLIGWANETGVEWDSKASPAGEHFACRLELYLRGPDNEPDPAKWLTEVAIKVAG
jgi:effector-binding domain-containing protein